MWLTSDCDFCVPRASTPSPRRVSSSRSASGSPEPAAKKHPGAASPARSRSPSANWSPAKKAKSPSQSPSPARVFVHQAALLWFLGQALVGEVELLSGPRVIHRGKISHSSWLKICNINYFKLNISKCGRKWFSIENQISGEKFCPIS